MVALNAANAVEQQDLLVARCTFPLLQDAEAVDAFGLLGGRKDDFYVYDATGALSAWLPVGGETPTDLSTAAGREALDAAVRAAQ